MELETHRLLVRDLQEADLEAMVRIWGQDRVAVFMDGFGPRTKDEVVAWLPEAIGARADNPRYGGCAMVEKSTGSVVGWIGFGDDTRGVADIDFGYAVHPDFQGRGFAAEALSVVVEHCFSRLGVSSVWGECHPDNLASRRTMEKAGLAFIGEVNGLLRFRVERPAGDA